jgi:hypothetical protein
MTPLDTLYSPHTVRNAEYLNQLRARAFRLHRYYASCLSRQNPLTTRHVVRPFGRGAAAIDARLLLNRRIVNARLKESFR